MIRNVLRSYRSIIIMAVMFLAFTAAAAYSGIVVSDALNDGVIKGRRGRVIVEAQSSGIFYYTVFKHAFGFACSGFAAIGIARIAQKMHKKGLLLNKERPPQMPRHFSAPLIDPTKRSNK